MPVFPRGDWSHVGERGHAVQFYSEDRHLIALLARYIGTALVTGNVGVTIATKAHRDALALSLKRRGMDVGVAERNGTYVALDAASLLRRFMHQGMPAAERFDAVIGSVMAALRHVCQDGSRRVFAFGEMVALLWADGRPDAAEALEKLWNRLAHEHAFTLCCAYPMKSFSRGEMGSFMRLCAQHSHVFAAESTARPGSRRIDLPSR